MAFSNQNLTIFSPFRRKGTVEFMKSGEYDIKEMKALLDSMSGMYDLVRVVDPIECRTLELGDDGSISMCKSCYGIWDSEQKCANCSSAIAHKTGCNQEKTEYFKDNIYNIQSNPVKLRLPDGGVFEAVVELVSIKSASLGVDGDVNDREKENTQNRSMRYRANYDSLTGILKADTFFECVRELLIKGKHSAWKMIIGDIIDFKLFNSLFGVEKGNEVLLKIATLLKKIADNGDGICARLYRDKFAILLPAESYSEEVFNEAAKAVNDAFATGVYTILIHFGIYDITNPDIPVSVMCDRANMALRNIKGSYRSNIAYFDDAIMQKSIDEQKIISGFDKALAENQLQMYLQPITGEDGKPFSAEALARWIYPDGTVISPVVFIKVLEDAGLIHRLDEYIWEQAVKQLAAWKNTERAGLTISVNMSAKDFYNIDVFAVLKGLTEKYGVPCDRLRIEITESELIENTENIYPIIEKLQENGFLVEIDDFGKGQSSLGLLKDINADILKIDMSLLQEIESKRRSRIILSTVIKMANELGMQVITEGVETESQMKSLLDMGCSKFQGFYFSKPMPVEEFEKKYAF